MRFDRKRVRILIEHTLMVAIAGAAWFLAITKILKWW